MTFEPISKPVKRRNVVLCVGTVSIWHVKGFDRILFIWKNIHRQHPDWSLEIAGPGDDEALTFLQNLCQEYGISESVNFIGKVDNIQNLYQTSSIFALPSRIEGFPMVLLEAMSQGCSCVSFDIKGAIYEILKDGEDGFIVPDGDMDLFTQKLEQLISNENQRLKFAENAVKNVSRFSQDAFLKKWEDILAKV